MGILSDALRLQAEASEEKARASIIGVDPDGLVGWCREAIRRHKEMLAMVHSSLDPKPLISRAVGHDDEIAALELAKVNRDWHNALVASVKERRIGGQYIPGVWREHLFDVFLDIRKKPDGRGRNSEAIRDDAVCRVIETILMHIKINATRNDATKGKRCAADIVAEAVGVDYTTIETIWKRYRKRLKSTNFL